MKAEPIAPIPETSYIYDQEVEKYLKDAVHIEPMALEEEFIRIPSDLAYWNEKYAVSLREYLTAKAERERIEGQLMCDPTFAAELETEIGKRPTVDQLKGGIRNNERYISAQVRERAADTERHRLRGCVDAIGAKRDMLISLGAHHRLEMMGDPIVRRNMADARRGD